MAWSHPDSAEAFAEQVIEVLLSADTTARFRTQAIQSSDEFSIEHMVTNFTEGIQRALNAA